MLLLPNGCRCSEPSVHPANWNKSAKAIHANWYVQYYFYGKENKRKLCIVKGRLSSATTWEEKRQMATFMIEKLKELLYAGYNPITRNIELRDVNEMGLSENTPWIQAVKIISATLKLENATRKDLICYLKKIYRASDTLLLSSIPVSEIRRKHIKAILIHLEQKEKLSAHGYNKTRTYLMMLFKELMEFDLVEYNLVRDISKRKTIRRLRDVLTDDERTRVSAHLFANHYPFWRFMQIFFHSGARIREMLAVKVKDVDLQRQRFKVLIKKGRNSHEEWRVIKDIALPFWQELLNGATATDYIFSAGLVPGKNMILREQITRRWYVHVKKKLGIQADFYSLKHLNLDEVAARLDINAAAEMAGHTTPVITLKHYAIGEKQREAERLKKINNQFS